MADKIFSGPENSNPRRWVDMGDGSYAPTVYPVGSGAGGGGSGGSLSAGEAHIGEVGGNSGVPQGSTTRPSDTTAYAVGDLIANSTTAGSVTPISIAAARVNDKSFVGRRLRLRVNDTAFKSTTVRVHLFRNSPTVTVGDNGVLNSSDVYAFTESEYIGYQDVVLTQQTSDGFVKGFVTTDFIAIPAAGTQNIFALLECRTVVTPGSGKQFTLQVETLKD